MDGGVPLFWVGASPLFILRRRSSAGFAPDPVKFWCFILIATFIKYYLLLLLDLYN